jgi:hypothetical protein
MATTMMAIRARAAPDELPGDGTAVDPEAAELLNEAAKNSPAPMASAASTLITSPTTRVCSPRPWVL